MFPTFQRAAGANRCWAAQDVAYKKLQIGHVDLALFVTVYVSVSRTTKGGIGVQVFFQKINISHVDHSIRATVNISGNAVGVPAAAWAVRGLCECLLSHAIDEVPEMY